jgi:hypothetical protein
LQNSKKNIAQHVSKKKISDGQANTMTSTLLIDKKGHHQNVQILQAKKQANQNPQTQQKQNTHIFADHQEEIKRLRSSQFSRRASKN